MAKKAKPIQKKSTPKQTPVLNRVTRIAKGIVKAMGAKSNKQKPKTKSPPVGKGQGAATKPSAKTQGKQLKPTSKIPHPKTDKPAPKPAPKPVPQKELKPAPKPMPASPAVASAAKGKAKGKSPAPMTPAGVSMHSDRGCREAGCENPPTTKGYCRLDYIKNWKKIKRKEMILKEGKLNQYIEELVSKYPEKYIEVIRQDLSTEVNFTKVIHDLELDESIDELEYDGDSIDSLIGSIRKEDEGFDDTDY